MPVIAAVAAELVAAPLPVLCLDTCELLAALQCLPQRYPLHLDGLRRLQDGLTAAPPRVALVLTDLVLHEWNQNYDDVLAKPRKYLEVADQENEAIRDARVQARLPGAPVASRHTSTTLLSDLTALALAVSGMARILDRDLMCHERAYSRVLAKTRPSRDGRIKDSVHLEHYLELCRQLRAGGFGERCVFVSGNKSDFCDAGGHIHFTIAPDLAAVALEFFANLHAAVGSLRL